MTISFILKSVEPFRLDYTVWALRRRSKNIVDQWDGKNYIRLFNIDNSLIKVILEQKDISASNILVTTNKKVTKKIQQYLSNKLHKMLGLDYNLKNFYALAKKDFHLNPLVNQFMGLKPPRFSSIFEALVNTISCQQISLDAGLQIQNRLIQYINLSLKEKNQLFYAFPRPIDIANCTVSNLKTLGYSTHKCETIIQLSSKIVENESIFDCLEDKPNEEIIKYLCQFKGIGRWSAEYVLLRGLGRIDIFPGDDVGARKNLQHLLDIDKKLDYENTSALVRKWHPYAGFIYFHLLLSKLRERQILK